MANQRVERQIEHLKALRAEGSSDATRQEVRKALGDRVNIVVAKAAALASEWESASLQPAVLSAYDRLFQRPAESDPQCWAKIELAKCLAAWGVNESACFLRGAQHVQWESTWGGKIDTAAALRSTCLLALVQCLDLPRHEILVHLVEALTDAEAGVRLDAVRACEQMGGREVSLLLRLKARSGDKEPHVTGQVLESVLNLEGAAGIAFVKTFLSGAVPEIREEAALAMGASRLPAAIDVLMNAWQQADGQRDGSSLLRGLSASRHDTALQFLLNQVVNAHSPLAQEALWALQLHRDSSELVERIAHAIAGRPELTPLFRQIFPDFE